MFKSLHDFFSSKSSSAKDDGQPSDDDLKLAAATLMFEVVRCDGRIEKVELVTMTEVLRRQFKLGDEDLESMLKLARESSNEATCLQSFTRQICDTWGNAKRVKLLEYLWIIALADQKIDSHERHLVRKIAALLYLNQGQILEARERAKLELGIDDFASV